MKKRLFALGASATLLAGILAPTTSFAAAETSAVIENSSSSLGESKIWVGNIEGNVFVRKNKENLPKKYYYEEDGYGGVLELYKYREVNGKWWGVYQGYLYKL
ncbi:MAG: hypothetical protein ACQEXX_28235 [Bacillota bacterium]